MSDDNVEPYDRSVLVDVLVYHYRTSSAGCGCGWAKLGHSHAEHVADVYEMSVVAHCAGRMAVAHDRTPMVDGRCPVCGEIE